VSLSNIQKALQTAISTTSTFTFSGVRQAGVATPCYVYEITSAAVDVVTSGIPSECHWTMTVQIEAIADTVDGCIGLVDDLRAQFDQPITDASNKCVLVLSAFSVTMSTESIDDGKTDAERIGTVQLELLVQETL
jgi:hypothetical protein